MWYSNTSSSFSTPTRDHSSDPSLVFLPQVQEKIPTTIPKTLQWLTLDIPFRPVVFLVFQGRTPLRSLSLHTYFAFEAKKKDGLFPPDLPTQVVILSDSACRLGGIPPASQNYVIQQRALEAARNNQT